MLMAMAVPMTDEMSVQMIDASAMIHKPMFTQRGRCARFICAKSSPVTDPSLMERAFIKSE
jgi:hypothetical protein